MPSPAFADFPVFIARTAMVCACVLSCASASAAVLSVGAGKTFSTPCKAFAVAASGDTVEIDGASGTYIGDVCAINASNLVIRGVNGRPKIDAGGRNAMGKGIWVLVGHGTVIENVEMYGAKVVDKNGAAIRLDGRDLTLRGSFLHDNENGILTSNDGVSNIVIESSEFGHNGYGDGYSHNLYVGRVNSLIFRYNYSHDANVGHSLKSRAQTNTIVYNRFSSTPPGQTGSTASGQPSYEIDLPNAGTAYVIGNVIEQPAANQNPAMLAYGEEGATNASHELYVVNNTFLNDDGLRGTFLFIGSTVATPALLQNNVFAGIGTVATQANVIDRTNYRSPSPAFVDRASYDLRPAAGSPMIDGGTAPGTSTSGVSLMPVAQYKHVASSEARVVSGTIDIGAYEAAAAPAPTPTPIDTTPPVVGFGSPPNGSHVSGIVSITVNATDDRGVAKVVLFLNGKQLASTTNATLSVIWNTAKATGRHTLTATAYDTSNNQASTSIKVIAVK